MIYIPNSDKRAVFKKGYVITFFLGIIFLLTGFVFTSIVGFTPRLNYGDPGYEEYIDLIVNLGTLSTLFINLGLGLFLLSTFVGAMTDKRFSLEVKKGMLLSSLLGIIALVIFNYLIIYIGIT